MATTTASIDVPASPDRIWQLIGGFDSLPDWLPYIPTSELSEGGRVRSLRDEDGGVIIERLEAFDNTARTYTYSILGPPSPSPATAPPSPCTPSPDRTRPESSGPAPSPRPA